MTQLFPDVQQTAEDQPKYSHVGVQLEVSGPVSQGKVVLGQFGLGRVKSHLVAGQPALVAQHGGGVDDGTLEVDVAAQVHVVALVARLQLPTLLTENRIIVLNVSFSLSTNPIKRPKQQSMSITQNIFA